ncbi:MAG TPA: hypothetical protein VMS75_10505 [Terriglobales bacterium]|nr:hypothetical protein [Terriglobales bacterium]
MKRRWIACSLVAAAVAVLGVAGLAKDTPVSSQWAAGPVRIDGSDQDWQGATFLTDPDSMAKYAVMNDGKNLYVFVQFADEKSASTIESTGMKVFFNADDKKSKDLGVLFTRKALPTETMIAEMEKRGEALSDERKAELRKQKTQMVLVEEPINAKKLAAPADPAVKTEPPLYRTTKKQRAQSYEFRIPLSRVNQVAGIGAEPGRTIKLGFEWGGLTDEMKRDMMGPRGLSGPNPGLSDSLANERNDSAGGSGAVLRHDPRTRQHSFWIDLKLAAQ